MTIGRTVLLLALLGLAACATTPEYPAPSSTAEARQTEVAQPASPASALHVNDAGLKLIKESEGLHLHAYVDTGQWLIGYGHAEGAHPGAWITAARAEQLLHADLAICEHAVAGSLTRQATPNQFSAMVSLCYNIGAQRFAASTMVRRFNDGNVEGAADAFLDWTKGTVNGTKVVLPRLEDRRRKERVLFMAT